eukprot:11518581-Heterocapsa_arctica.AAC.1
MVTSFPIGCQGTFKEPTKPAIAQVYAPVLDTLSIRFVSAKKYVTEDAWKLTERSVERALKAWLALKAPSVLPHFCEFRSTRITPGADGGHPVAQS